MQNITAMHVPMDPGHQTAHLLKLSLLKADPKQRMQAGGRPPRMHDTRQQSQ